MRNRCEQINCESSRTLTFPTAGQFDVADREMVQIYLDKYRPWSCEYNFANLFCWQNIYHYTWRLFKGRLLVYDGLSQCAFMPLGEPLTVDELVEASKFLLQSGLEPHFGVADQAFVEANPQLERHYTIESHRDHAEYIYDVEKLYTLTGTKLHKKRNLISQFKRRYPGFHTKAMDGRKLGPARKLAAELLARRKPVTKELTEEFSALERALDHFCALGLDGVELWVEDELVAFAIFSPLGKDVYDVQFEKI
ncbi:MAG: DUF2156 domain-containing protein, partial [Desulfobacterales bacterium]|nr:DUF2156 domain-containing protein [Desulfobacterales bacterium]